MLAEATVVLILESNLGFESHHMWSAISKQNLGNICCMRGKDGSPGLLTTHQVKESACRIVNERLEEGSISISKSLVCVGPKTTARSVLKNLREEFVSYSVIVELPTTPFGKARRTYSGKVGSGQDDSIIATQLGLFWRSEFLVNPKYYEWRN